jgi:hypothetical protein
MSRARNGPSSMVPIAIREFARRPVTSLGLGTNFLGSRSP